MDSLTDWIATGIAGIAALVSIWGARDARRSAAQSRLADERRAAGRTTVRHAMDAGNALLEDMRRVRSRGEIVEEDPILREEYLRWEDSANEAVEAADPAQLPRYHSPLTVKNRIHVMEERMKRLQEIQDRL